jgi:hypothetical protein
VKLLLRFSFLLLLVSACSHTPTARAVKPTEYFQTYTFAARSEDVQKTVLDILKGRKYEIISETDSEITAVNSEVTSVQVLTYAKEHTRLLQSVYAGEIKLVIDLTSLPEGGTFVNIRADIRAVRGRSSFLKNKDWQGKDYAFSSRGKLENEILQDIARTLKEKDALARLVTRGVELEGGFTLQ